MAKHGYKSQLDSLSERYKANYPSLDGCKTNAEYRYRLLMSNPHLTETEADELISAIDQICTCIVETKRKRQDRRS